MGQVILANMIREIWEDSIRHADDKAVNHRKVELVENGKSEQVMGLLIDWDTGTSLCTRQHVNE